MDPDERWVVMAPTASEGIYREIASFTNEADATEFCDQEGEGNWQVLDATEMDVEQPRPPTIELELSPTAWVETLWESSGGRPLGH
jgi:hypothetical protein